MWNRATQTVVDIDSAWHVGSDALVKEGFSNISAKMLAASAGLDSCAAGVCQADGPSVPV